MQKRHLFAACCVLAIAAGSSSASAQWGCGWSSTDLKGNPGRIWNAETQKEAREASLRQCKAYKHQGCYIIGCKQNVANKEDADKIWPMRGEPAAKCGSPGWPAC